jgi:Nucleotidyl transferase AbiEii toxin, Type IV TA system
MPVSDLHRQLAAIALGAAGRYGFALAGGNALIAHGVVNRFTADVDLFTDEEAGVAAAAEAVEAALTAAGFQAERRDKTGGLADIFPDIGGSLAEWMLQMAYFERDHRPVAMDIGPVLSLEDVLGSKVCALASRVEPRDYVDTAAALERYRPAQLIGFARRLDPGLTDQDFADAGRRLDELNDRRFTAFGLSPQEIAELRERFATWPRS